MQYNTCQTCGADGGRAGYLVQRTGKGPAECANCDDTRRSGIVTLHSFLNRTYEEIAKTADTLKEENHDNNSKSSQS